MNQLEQAFFDASFAAKYPMAAGHGPKPEAKPQGGGTKAVKPPEPAPVQAQEVGAGMHLADALAGTIKGAVSQALGLPGDIRELVDMVAGETATKLMGDRTFLTTEEFRAVLPSVVPKTEDIARAAAREAVAQFAEDMGTMVAPAAVLKKGARKVAAKASAGAVTGTAATATGGREIKYDERGKRK